MGLWWILLVVAGCGALGGVANALLSENGFLFPKTIERDNLRVLMPGFLGNMFVGALGACVSWGLYGPFAAVPVMGASQATGDPAVNLSLSGLVGAILVGVAGARWLTNEVDKTMLRAAASEALARPEKAEEAAKVAVASPAEAWRIAAES